MLLEQPRLGHSSSGRTICVNRDGETTETDRQTERQKCLIPLIAPGDFLLLWSVLCGDEKQISERCLQSRPLIFAEISPKSSRSKVRAELRGDNCAQVCSSSFRQNETDTVWKNAEICTTMTQKSLFSVQNSHSEGIKHFCDTLTWHRSTLFFWYFL